jgi:periplasmic copper chaperone A
MRFMAPIAAAALALSLATNVTLAGALSVGSLTITGLWTTATPPGAPTAAAYLTITNNGTMPDSLVAVSSPLASVGMLHRMDLAGGIASMHMLPAIEIPPGKTVTFAPDAFHIMFVALKQPLKAGETMPVTLIFQKAGRLDAALPVLPIGAKGLPGQ